MTANHQFDNAIDIINKRSKRAIATILGVKEREADPFLPSAVSDKLRKVVMDQVNELVDLSIDCVKSAAEVEPGSITNDAYFDVLNSIHDTVIEIASRE